MYPLIQVKTTKYVALLEVSREEAVIYLRSGTEETRKKTMEPLCLWVIVNEPQFVNLF